MDHLLDHAPCGFLSFADDRSILSINATLSQWLGYEPQELAGRPMETILTPGGRIFCQTHIFPLLKLKGQVEEIYFSLKRRGGGTLDVLTSASRSLREGIFVSDCVFLPMSQRREYEGELLQAKKVAEEASLAKARFLSMMSHELRTPMNAILGFGQLLSMGPLPQVELESVQHILTAGEHLLQLINEVLDLSRIDAGRLDLSLGPLLTQKVMSEAFEMARPLAARAHIDLQLLSAADDRRHVTADGGRLRQVLLNLLANGIKYNRAGGSVTLQCESCAAQEGSTAEWLRFVVSDTGAGIPPHKLNQLFMPFERLGAEDSAIEGTGLGLALCKRLTEAMGGQIGVSSVEGQGSSFWAQLPLAEEPVALVPRPVLPGLDYHPESAASAAESVVLYIEDNASNRALVEGVLKLRPALRLLLAVTGGAGLEAARDHRPDLILLDAQLPDLPGSEVLTRLRKDALTRDIPVVILSADATPEQRKHLLQAGAHDYITKPFDVKAFLATVDILIDGKAVKGSAIPRGAKTASLGQR